MVDSWIEQNLDEILDRYAHIRTTRYDDKRTVQQLRDVIRPVMLEIARGIRGEADWKGFMDVVVKRVIATHASSAASVADACEVSYRSVIEVMEKHQVPDLMKWKLAVAEQMLDGGRWVSHTLDELLSRNLALVKDGATEREKLQQQVIDAQQMAIRELSTPIIPVLDGMIVMPVVGSVDTLRARDILRALLAGIREHRARVVIVDVTGVTVIDTGVANHLTKAIMAARLKGAHTIVTGLSDAAAETIVEMGIDWSGIQTSADLQTGLAHALNLVGLELTPKAHRASPTAPSVTSPRRA